MGVKAGVPDFLIFDEPQVAFELKALDGKITEQQMTWLNDLSSRGWIAGWCRGASNAIEWLESLGYGK